MRRALLLAAIGGVALALLLFPRARKALGGISRAFLLTVAGLLVLSGASRLFSGTLPPLEAALAIGGLCVLVPAFLLVLRDALKR